MKGSHFGLPACASDCSLKDTVFHPELIEFHDQKSIFDFLEKWRLND